MENLKLLFEQYLLYCKEQKRLDEKTQKAYRIDITQFLSFTDDRPASEITPQHLEKYLSILHETHKPKSVRRKIASLKAFFHYLEYRDIIERTPFHKLQIQFREPTVLPKTIPLHVVEKFLAQIYAHEKNAATIYQKRNALRDAAVSELLFSSGMRICELCSLKAQDIHLYDGTILICGKGSKERRIQIGNEDVLEVLRRYHNEFQPEISACGHFFANQSGRPLSDQCVRRMIRKYVSLASIDMRITPHMFRHTFATCLLEADVDIRYIQEMLGHSSIHITEIYTHVAVEKQRSILAEKHPRKDFGF